MKLKALLAVLAAAALYFALFGGEYSLFELYRLEEQREHEAAQLDEIRGEVERLRAQADSLESDPVTLERIARERYGMIRKGERLYRFTECSPRSGSQGSNGQDTTTACGD